MAAYLVLFGRLVYWQGFRHWDMVRIAASYHNDTLTLPAVRGRIIDRNGSLLASNTPVFSIFASPDQITARDRPRHRGAAGVAARDDVGRCDGQAGHNQEICLYCAARFGEYRPPARFHCSCRVSARLARRSGLTWTAPCPARRWRPTSSASPTTPASETDGVEGYYDRILGGQPGFEATVRDLAEPADRSQRSAEAQSGQRDDPPVEPGQHDPGGR